MTSYKELRAKRIQRRRSPEATMERLAHRLISTPGLFEEALAQVQAPDWQKKSIRNRLGRLIGEKRQISTDGKEHESVKPVAMSTGKKDASSEDRTSRPGQEVSEGVRYTYVSSGLQYTYYTPNLFSIQFSEEMARYLCLKPPTRDYFRKNHPSLRTIGMLLLVTGPTPDQIREMENAIVDVVPRYSPAGFLTAEQQRYGQKRIADEILGNDWIFEGLSSHDSLSSEEKGEACKVLLNWADFGDLVLVDSIDLESAIKIALQVSSGSYRKNIDIHSFGCDEEAPQVYSASYETLIHTRDELVLELVELLSSERFQYFELECTLSDLRRVSEQIRLRTAPDGSILSPEGAKTRAFKEMIGKLWEECPEVMERFLKMEEEDTSPNFLKGLEKTKKGNEEN